MRRNRTAGAGSRKSKAGGVTPAGFSLDPERAGQRATSWGLQMIDTVNSDVRTLKEWLRSAWRQLANPNLTRLEQRELRYYMRDVERALRSGLKQIADLDTARGEVRHETPARKYPTFRLLNA